MFSKFRVTVPVAVLALAATASTALAQATQPAEMPDISFPISLTSLVTKIGVAGATLLGLTFGIVIAFRFVKKLMKRATSAV